VLTKRAVMAQANLLARTGVKFQIVAHSGTAYRDGSLAGFCLDLYHVKKAGEPWGDEQKDRLRKLGPYQANLDGHALEYLRREADRQQATDKIILYYSDGKMPAANHAEELEILQREIHTCKQKDITLLGVGIRTDSPARHGLDTVQVDSIEDIVKVVRHLEKRLTE
jgi:nitric oxide reductase activation protein